MGWGSRDQLRALSQPSDCLYFDKIGKGEGGGMGTAVLKEQEGSQMSRGQSGCSTA